MRVSSKNGVDYAYWRSATTEGEGISYDRAICNMDKQDLIA